MTDTLTSERRSANMRAIRSQDMKPELRVRRIAHAMGYRFRLHRRDLPSKPDLVFSSRQKAIFVHGCFWRQHVECEDGHLPRSNSGYWGPKLMRNKERDTKPQCKVKKGGWEVLIIWECETEDERRLRSQIDDFLSL